MRNTLNPGSPRWARACRCVKSLRAGRGETASGLTQDLQRLHSRRSERPRHARRGWIRHFCPGRDRTLCSRLANGSRTPRPGNNAGASASSRLRIQFLSRWPSSPGGSLQDRRGWCNSSTGFQPSLPELRLGETFYRAEVLAHGVQGSTVASHHFGRGTRIEKFMRSLACPARRIKLLPSASCSVSNAPVAQGIERRASNAEVAGESPAGSANFIYD